MSFLTEWKQFKAQAARITELETQAGEMAETIKSITESEAKAQADLKVAQTQISELTGKLTESEAKQSDFDKKVAAAAIAQLASAGHPPVKIEEVKPKSDDGKPLFGIKRFIAAEIAEKNKRN